MVKKYDPETYSAESNYLQSGTIIDQYMIERELAHGGFSSVYLARQLEDQVQVAIKEYLPRKLAHRAWNNRVASNSEKTKNKFIKGRTLFFEEAKVLARLKHPNIVDVINFFQANDTAYMVMTYDYGITLDKIIRRNLLVVTEQLLITLFLRLLTGVEFIHKHDLLHLDIKPGNILIRPDNEPLLLDFGAIQQYSTDNNIESSRVITQGFSPVEQSSIKNKLGPWSDIYAIGASLRFCLDGKVPVSATERAKTDSMPPATKAFKGNYPEYFLQAIDWAMNVVPEKRPQSIKVLQSCLFR